MKYFFKRMINILVFPRREFPAIKKENKNIRHVIVNYLVPLTMISILFQILGVVITGQFIYGTVTLLGSIASIMLVTLVISGCVLLTALIFDILRPIAGVKRNYYFSLCLAVYSSTPIFLASIVSVVKLLKPVSFLFTIYGLVLFSIGVIKLIDGDKEKKPLYIFLSLITIILTYVLLAVALAIYFV